MSSLLFVRFVVPLMYAGAVIAYGLLLKGVLKRSLWPARLFRAGLAVHFIEILARGAESGAAGGAPFVGLTGFISLFAFLLGVIYVALEVRYKVHSLGLFHTSVVLILQLSAAVTKTPVTRIPPLNTGHLFVLHVVPAAVAYAAFTVSFIAAVAYLLLDRALRKKQRGLLMRGLPPLDLVEAVNAAGVKIGLPLLFVVAVVGVVMGYRAWGADYHWDPKNWLTFGIVAIYGAQLALRRFAGWAGRRAVLISLVGYGAILLGVTVINVLFSKLHGSL